VDKLGSTFPLSDSRCLWDCDRTRLDSAHAGERFEPPFTNVERRWQPVTKRVTKQEFIDYLKTQSAYQKLLAKGEKNPLQEVEASVAKEKESELDVTFPFWIITGYKAATTRL
jgi:hypothetical protein